MPDDFAAATLESLLNSLLELVKELTSNLEEAGRGNSSLTRHDSTLLRQMTAELIATMLGGQGSTRFSSKDDYRDTSSDTVTLSVEVGPLCVVSEDFKRQVVATLFEWLYHSGIRLEM